MVRIVLGKKFNFQYLLLTKDNPGIKTEVEKRILWFRKNPLDTRLDGHALKKRMKGKFAFAIDEDVRIVYEWSGKTTARFLAIGEHIQVYRRFS